jgi:hypothetical protein
MWVTRAGRKGGADPIFFGENVVALGWSAAADLADVEHAHEHLHPREETG